MISYPLWNITTIINYYLHYNTFLQWFCNAWIIHNLPQFTKAFIVCRPSPRMIILKSLWCGSSYRSAFQFVIKSKPKFWTLHSLFFLFHFFKEERDFDFGPTKFFFIICMCKWTINYDFSKLPSGNVTRCLSWLIYILYTLFCLLNFF